MPATVNPWRYVQSTGNLYRPEGTLESAGYSGRGEGLNNPALQNKQNGPIPVGKYTCANPVLHPRFGEDAVPLAPFPTNTLFGRTGFWAHGAIDGCLVLPRAVRLLLVPGTVLEVVAYP